MMPRTPTLADESFQASRVVTLEVAGPVASICLGSGERRNVLAPSDWDELARVADRVATRDDVNVVVLRGGGQTLCAGSDLRFWQDEDSRTVDDDFARMEKIDDVLRG